MSAGVAAISPLDLRTGMTHVFETMFFRPVESIPPDVGFASPAFLVTVGFEGEAAGCCELVMTAAEAAGLAFDFLGCDAEQQTPDQDRVVEVLCELGNMVCGHILSLTAPGSLFQILSPSCSSLPADSELPDVTWSRFQLDDGQVAVRILFRSEGNRPLLRAI